MAKKIDRSTKRRQPRKRVPGEAQSEVTRVVIAAAKEGRKWRAHKCLPGFVPVRTQWADRFPMNIHSGDDLRLPRAVWHHLTEAASLLRLKGLNDAASSAEKVRDAAPEKPDAALLRRFAGNQRKAAVDKIVDHCEQIRRSDAKDAAAAAGQYAFAAVEASPALNGIVTPPLLHKDYETKLAKLRAYARGDVDAKHIVRRALVLHGVPVGKARTIVSGAALKDKQRRDKKRRSEQVGTFSIVPRS